MLTKTLFIIIPMSYYQINGAPRRCYFLLLSRRRCGHRRTGKSRGRAIKIDAEV